MPKVTSAPACARLGGAVARPHGRPRRRVITWSAGSTSITASDRSASMQCAASGHRRRGVAARRLEQDAGRA